ncbi:MAG TPA: FAD-dependent monooxygenase [Candidatus Limnocylindrales bacterium]|nr:FAD-dependent monooxygenase [Candidatus Limnocylindrales bacterium]
MSTSREVEVAVVGGGPAGAATAILLAAAGREVALFERRATPVWRACGVYSSPMTRQALVELGLSPSAVAALATPIAAMLVETAGGARLRLAHDPPFALGVDRPALDAALLARAREAGAEVHEGTAVTAIAPAGSGRIARLRVAEGAADVAWAARVVVGADGPRSMVARAAGLARRLPLLHRAGLTCHVAAPGAHPADLRPGPAEARMIVGRGWYVGLAPVPGRRINVGLVLAAGRFRAGLAEMDPGGIVKRALGQLPGDAARLGDAERTDEVRVAYPLGHRVAHAAGRGVLLVGDAAGFVDPISGEGIHRALASAGSATEAVQAYLRGSSVALEGHDRRMRDRFGAKDVVAWLLQAFMARPSLLDYAVRRLDRRQALGRTFGLVLADLVPAARALEPRFLLELLAP